LESKDGDLKNTNEESYGSCNWIIIESWHWKEMGSPSYVHDRKHQYKWGPLGKL
jgi:hypothetical protein